MSGGTVDRSVAAMLRNQDAGGAFVASPDFSQYQYCWLRDGSFTAYALDVAGEHAASARYHAWVGHAIEGIGKRIDAAIARNRDGRDLDPARMPPARFALGGSVVADDWPNFQMDGYGTWLWALGEHLSRTGREDVPPELGSAVACVARYLDEFAFAPCYDVWEEYGTAVHTSTLACVHGGLASAARLLGDPGLTERSDAVRGVVRDAAVRLGRHVKSSDSDEVDSSLLWLSVPFGVVDPLDPLLAHTVRVIEEWLTFEGGLRRYRGDTFFGSGAWPVLTASLGCHHAAAGHAEGARRARDWVAAHFDDEGRLGEQFGGERRDKEHYSEWVDRWGPPAADLTWSHAMYVVLCAAIDTDASPQHAAGVVSAREWPSGDGLNEG